MSEWFQQLSEIYPKERMSTREVDRVAYSRDMWPRNLLQLRENQPLIRPPEVVVWPRSAAEIAATIQFARHQGVPVVPWGGGSGVCGAAMALKGGIIIDLKRMARLIDVNVDDQIATFEAGVIGQHLEDQLNLRGLTLGHFPSSIYCSTLGGWLATRSAGQASSRYGKIEDMVQRMEVVLGDGSIIQASRAGDYGVLQAMVGSEGTLGVITQASMSTARLPEQRCFRAYRFEDLEQGCNAMRQILRLGLRPSILRLYDEMDHLLARPAHSSSDRPRFRPAREALLGLSKTVVERLTAQALQRAGWVGKLADRVLARISPGCVLIMAVEGDNSTTEAQLHACLEVLNASGGEDLGAGPAQDWYQKRYAVSYRQSPLFLAGGMVDTMEVATTWDRLLNVYQDVREELARNALVLAHFSHAYPEGCSIYFTFAAAAQGRARSEALYDHLWRGALAAAVQAGATISHHHGIGVHKAGFMVEEHGQAMSVYRALKQVFDPAGILNPGKMGI